MEQESTSCPHFNLYPVAQTPTPQQERVVQDVDVSDSAAPPSQIHVISPRELDASPSQYLATWSRRNSKTDWQLEDGAVWTPSGYIQDLASDMHVQEAHHLPRLTLGSLAIKSPDKTVSPFLQPALSPTSPLNVCNPSEPFPTASETAVLHACSPTNAFPRERTSPCLSQAVKSTMPGNHRRSSSLTCVDLKNSQSPSRFLDRKSVV